MTYSMIVGKYKLIFSDTHFKDFRKKPTISVYDADTNSETKIASFNSQETFEWFIEAVVTADRKTEPQTITMVKDHGRKQALEMIDLYHELKDEPQTCNNCDLERCETCVTEIGKTEPQTERSNK